MLRLEPRKGPRKSETSGVFWVLVFVFNPHPRTFSFHCFLAREERKEEGRKTSIVASHTLPDCGSVPGPGIQPPWTRDLTCSLGMCPYQESNLQPFSYRSMFQPTEPHQPGLQPLFLIMRTSVAGSQAFQFSPSDPWNFCCILLVPGTEAARTLSERTESKNQPTLSFLNQLHSSY